jgi:hypothetical protein
MQIFAPMLSLALNAVNRISRDSLTEPAYQERAAGMSVDTPWTCFHNFKMAEKSSKERQKSLERALEEAVSRALRDNLAPLQRTADELQHAYADLVAACSSSRPSNALPALQAQTGVPVHELVSSSQLGTSFGAVPRWRMAGVAGALLS